MIPVDQTKFGFPQGNCVMACAASILELGIEDLPDLYESEDMDWWMVFRRAMAEYRWEALYVGPEYVSATDPQRLPVDLRPFGWSIAGGPSPRSDVVDENGDNAGHAVVARDGEIVFDPHPSRNGLAGPVEDWVLMIPPA